MPALHMGPQLEENLVIRREALQRWWLVSSGSTLLVGMALALIAVNLYLLLQPLGPMVPGLVYTMDPIILATLGLGIALQLIASRWNPFRRV